MAWSTTLAEKNIIYMESYGSVQIWESGSAQQVASGQSDYIRISISFSMRAYNTSAPSTKNYKVTCGSTTITSSSTSSTQTIDVPSGWAGQTISITGSMFTWSGITLGAAGCYALTITTGSNVSGTVSRTSSSSGLGGTGTLSSGALIYSGDVLKITYTASTGYSGSATANGSAVSSGGSVTVSAAVTVVFGAEPMATVHVWNGSSWDLYLVYVYSGSAWGLYQFNVYNGSAWEKYY